MEEVRLLQLSVGVLRAEVYRPAKDLLLLGEEALEEEHLVVDYMLIDLQEFQNEHHWLFPVAEP